MEKSRLARRSRADFAGFMMAFSDYHPCDQCHSRTFYDAALNYDVTDAGIILYDGYRAVALCRDCEKLFEIQIVPKREATR